MWVLGFLLVVVVYLIAVVIVGYLVHRVSDRKISMFSVCAVLLLLPVAYGLFSYLPGYVRLQSLCNASDRSIIHKTVHVGGYLSTYVNGGTCEDGWEPLFDWSYKFHECSTAQIVAHNSFGQGDIYRFEIGKKGHPRCIKHETLPKKIKNRYSEKLNGRCLIREKVNEPKSRHMKLLEFGYVNSNGDHVLEFPNDRAKKGLISFVGYHVIDRVTGDTLAVSRNYEYWPLGIKNQFSAACKENKHIDFRTVLLASQ